MRIKLMGMMGFVKPWGGESQGEMLRLAETIRGFLRWCANHADLTAAKDYGSHGSCHHLRYRHQRSERSTLLEYTLTFAIGVRHV